MLPARWVRFRSRVAGKRSNKNGPTNLAFAGIPGFCNMRGLGLSKKSDILSEQGTVLEAEPETQDIMRARHKILSFCIVQVVPIIIKIDA